MRKIKYVFSLMLVLLAGCSEQKKQTETPVVYVSVLPQAGLAQAIAGTNAHIRVLIGAGQSPHSFEPTARQIAGLAEADALLTLGMPFEKQWVGKISATCPNLQIEEVSQGITKRFFSDTHEKGEPDPHVWLTPKNNLIMARNMERALEQIDPFHAAAYQKNLKKLEEKIEQLQLDLTRRLAPLKGTRFYVYHPSFGYFADEYGLEQVAIETDGKPPTSRQLATLIDAAKADGTHVIFVQKQFPQSTAKTIAKAIGARVVSIDPLAENPLEVMQQLAIELTENAGETNAK